LGYENTFFLMGISLILTTFLVIYLVRPYNDIGVSAQNIKDEQKISMFTAAITGLSPYFLLCSVVGSMVTNFWVVSLASYLINQKGFDKNMVWIFPSTNSVFFSLFSYILPLYFSRTPYTKVFFISFVTLSIGCIFAGPS